MNNHLVFDIETIPQGWDNLSDKQRKEIAKRRERNEEAWTVHVNRSMATSPWFGKIVSIGLYYPAKQEKLHITSTDEIEVLEKFWEKISQFSGTFISYNGLAFDVPFIKTRSMVLKVPPTNESFLDTRRYQIYPHFDVAQHVADWDNRARVSLDLVCDQLGVKSPKDGAVEASTVYEAFKEGRLQEIGEYCVEDLIATYSVFQIVRRFRK